MRNMFCNFCRSVGHNEKDYRPLELMKECTMNAYTVQSEEESEGGMCQCNTPRGYNQGGRRRFIGRGRG
jgi:hypothetical protein